MARIERQALLARFHEMIRKGQPIVGGGAGTGLSAKCEEAGGIDLIVIYNSGRYRMAGRGSLAGTRSCSRWRARSCRWSAIRR
jgi:predicted TIM-barrel enzyme